MATTLQVSQKREDIIIGKIRRYFAEKGMSAINIQPQTIRMEQEITGQGLNFEFEMGQRKNMRPLETSLSQADIFVPVDMAWGVMKVKNPEAGKGDLSGNSVFYTYPDKTVFAYAPVGNIVEHESLLALWNGRFAVKAATNEVINELSSQNFLRVARVQRFENAAAFTSYQEEEQYVPWYVNPLFRGDQINKLSFNSPRGADTVAASGAPDANASNVAVLILRGFIIRNAAQSISEADAIEFFAR